MNEKTLMAHCRIRNSVEALKERVIEAAPRVSDEVGLSKLAITIILVAAGVGLTLAVIAILGPAIMNLANQTGGQIESVPLDWGP
jgi:hypothetical protein